jgi:hypothetical protein
VPASPSGLAARVLLACLAVVVLAGCSTLSPPRPGEVLAHLWNTTDEPVGLYVNGQWVGTYPEDSSIAVPIAGHGGPPWSVTAQDQTGAVLANAIVSVEDAAGLASGERVVESSATIGCGLIRIMAGTAEAVAESIPQGGEDPACP